MKTKNGLKRILTVTALAMLAIGSTFIIAAPAQPQTKAKDQKFAPDRTIPLELGRSIPLDVQSSGVEWKGQTYHLVGLGSTQFELDQQTSHLKADIKAGVTGFDDVDYDIGAAVFDATGELLGTARAQCNVRRLWAGNVITLAQTISLDFGVSLDYAHAATFMVSVSKRRVLTPDDWQK